MHVIIVKCSIIRWALRLYIEWIYNELRMSWLCIWNHFNLLFEITRVYNYYSGTTGSIIECGQYNIYV